jgi:isopenicillin N synthase-like dioxygenase
VLLDWQQETTRLSIRLLRAFAEALQQPVDIFDDAFVEAPVEHLKIIRYPGSQQGAAGQGVGPHKDGGFLTLLLQDDSQDGLQVETEQGWIDAPSLPGSFIVNIGESLEMASDGYLRANVHRVLSPPQGKDRLSVAFFLGPRLDATIPLLQLPAELAAEARGPEADPDNPLFYRIGDNYLKGRLRSIPRWPSGTMPTCFPRKHCRQLHFPPPQENMHETRNPLAGTVRPGHQPHRPR